TPQTLSCARCPEPAYPRRPARRRRPVRRRAPHVGERDRADLAMDLGDDVRRRERREPGRVDAVDGDVLRDEPVDLLVNRSRAPGGDELRRRQVREALDTSMELAPMPTPDGPLDKADPRHQLA